MRDSTGGFLVMHKSTIEPTATLLLTAVSKNGTTLFQINTGYTSIPLMYHDTEKDNLYLAGNAKGEFSDRLNQMLSIDLKNDTINKYSIK